VGSTILKGNIMDKHIAAGFFAGMLGMLLISCFVISASLHRGKECTIEVTKGNVTNVRIGRLP
jgi:hypothetical protein